MSPCLFILLLKCRARRKSDVLCIFWVASLPSTNEININLIRAEAVSEMTASRLR